MSKFTRNNYKNNKNKNNNFLKRKLYENENLFQEAADGNNGNIGGTNLKYFESNNNNNNSNNSNNEQINNNEDGEEIIEEKNLNFLWSLSHYSQPINQSLGGYYMYKFREIANINELKGVPEQIESRNCKNCGTFLIPGLNCRVRIIKKSSLSNKSKSQISTTTNIENNINSLSNKFTKQQLNKQNKLNKSKNAIIQNCLQCNKLNPIKGESCLKRKSRKLNLKNYNEKLIKTTTTTTTTTSTTTPTSTSNDNKKIILPTDLKNNNKKQPAAQQQQQSKINNNNKKVKINQAGSKSIQAKEDSLKDFLSGIGGLLK